MNLRDLDQLLQKVADGGLEPGKAREILQGMPAISVGDLCLDTHREIRCGMPEVVYAKGKSHDQVMEAMAHLYECHGYVLATGVEEVLAEKLQAIYPAGVFVEKARLFKLGEMPRRVLALPIRVVSAGVSDLPVALEALHTLEFAGYPCEHISDVGVAGLHRLISRIAEIEKSTVIIAVAGMEGTLPGVLTGLVSKPVVAVPTSVGYGSHFGGLAPLLAMLNSCSSGMSVVNIDNGFGAAMMAIRIAKPQLSSEH